MAMVYKFGLMEQNMKDNGLKVKPMDRENLSMQMVMYIKENGKMIKLMDMEYILIVMEPNIRDTGEMIYKMDMGNKLGWTEAYMKVYTKMERNMGLVDINGLMVVYTKAAG